MSLNSSYQPGLPFEFDAINASTLRAAYARSRLNIPLESALHNKALSICLRHVAEALLKKRCRRRG
jgi:hypothetical protein